MHTLLNLWTIQKSKLVWCPVNRYRAYKRVSHRLSRGFVKAEKVTVKEKALTWAREDKETSSRGESDRERVEEELEILFPEARLECPTQGVEGHGTDTDGWKTVHR